MKKTSNNATPRASPTAPRRRKATARKAPDRASRHAWLVLIVCDDEAEQVALLERFVKEGLTCRALIS